MASGRRALACVLAAPFFVLAGCGGQDPDVTKIEQVVKDVAKDNAALCAHATRQLLALLGGSRAACEASARGYQATEASGIDGAIEVHVTGDTATAKFTTLAGSDRTVTFVRQGDAWLIDTVTG